MVLLTLPHLVNNAKGDGPFGWIPVTGGKRVKPEDWKAYIESLRTGFSKKPVSGIAFPGFHDFYQEAGLHPSYGRVDERNGDTFSETLDLNQRLAVDLVQIATWNDFGEGTAIETKPTTEIPLPGVTSKASACSLWIYFVRFAIPGKNLSSQKNRTRPGK